MNLDAPPWLVAWLEGISLWDALLWIAAAAAVAFFIWKKGWRTVVALARGVIASAEVLVSVQGLPAFIERTDQRLDEHTQQLTNSHDSNLRDDVTESIDLSKKAVHLAEGLHGRLDEVERNVAQLAKADIEIQRRIDNAEPPEEPTA